MVDSFAAGLQAGHDQRDADILNGQFAADVVWGSPYGALVDGYEQLHPIHVRFQQKATGTPAFRYDVRHVLALGEDVVVAHIARLALGRRRRATCTQRRFRSAVLRDGHVCAQTPRRRLVARRRTEYADATRRSRARHGIGR